MLDFKSKSLCINEFKRLIAPVSYNLIIKSWDFKNNYTRIFITKSEGRDKLYVNPDARNARVPYFGNHTIKIYIIILILCRIKMLEIQFLIEIIIKIIIISKIIIYLIIK